MYTCKNYKSKKAIKEDLAAGKTVDFFQPGGMFPTPDVQEGTIALEGPHYPEPHRWYATATIKGGKIVSIK